MSAHLDLGDERWVFSFLYRPSDGTYRVECDVDEEIITLDMPDIYAMLRMIWWFNSWTRGQYQTVGVC